jgi:hypothetical protein
MWTVKKEFQNRTLALPGEELKLSELKSERIEQLIKALPNLIGFFQKTEELAETAAPAPQAPAPMSEAEERAFLSARFEELRGRRPANNIRLSNLRAAVSQAEAESL